MKKSRYADSQILSILKKMKLVQRFQIYLANTA